MLNSKTSIFTSYAALVMVGFGGTAALSFFGKGNDMSAVVAFLGFYGFLCTTGIFYVLGKQKAAVDALQTYISEVNDSHYKNSESINRRIEDGLVELERETTTRFDTLWATLDRIETSVEDSRACVSSKK